MILARQEENQGNWAKALELYATIEDPFAWLEMARIAYMQNDFEKALSLVEKILNSGVYMEEALEIRTKIYARTERWQEAIADVERLIKRYPENQSLHLLLAKLKLFVSDFKGARRVLEALRMENDDFEALYTLSKACLGDQDKECAKKALERAIEGGTDFTPIYLDLGKIDELEGRFADAEDIYLKLLENDPESLEAHIALSDLYLQEGRNMEAISHMQTVLELAPNEEVLHKLVILELDSKMYTEALALLKGQEQYANEDMYYMAIAYAGLKQWNAALLVLEKVPKEDAGGCDAAILKASILEDMGRQDDALKELKSGWERYSSANGCKEIGYRLATALDDRGRRDEGMAIAQKLLDKDPHDPMMLNFIGYIWADEGKNLGKALKMIEEALQLRPGDGYILDSMGWALFKAGKVQDATGYIDKALEAYADDPIINTHMGDILCRQGYTLKALDYYLKAKVNSKQPSADLERKIDKILANPHKDGCTHE